MKTLTAGFTAYLAAGGNVFVRADNYTLTLADGVTVFRWTTADFDHVLGGNTFRAPRDKSSPAPIVQRGAFSNAQLPTIDQLQVSLIGGDFTVNGGQSLTLAAALGYFDGARLLVDHLIGPDLPTVISWGGSINSMFEGRVGSLSPNGNSLDMTAYSESITLARQTPFVVLTPSCCYSVYDTNCGISQAAFTLSGAVSGTPTAKAITTASVALTAKAAGYFDLGVITFTSGALNGQSFDVESWNGTVFTMALPLATLPGAGDTFTVYPGCPLTPAACAGKFNNFSAASGHWRGYTHIPTPESGS